jgi:hypothetical protein
LAFDIS